MPGKNGISTWEIIWMILTSLSLKLLSRLLVLLTNCPHVPLFHPGLPLIRIYSCIAFLGAVFKLRYTKVKIHQFKVYNSVISNILTILYNYLHCLIRKFPSSPKRNSILVNSHSQVPFTHIPRNNSVSLQIYLFWTLHIDWITVCNSLCLASFTYHNVFEVGSSCTSLYQ